MIRPKLSGTCLITEVVQGEELEKVVQGIRARLCIPRAQRPLTRPLIVEKVGILQVGET